MLTNCMRSCACIQVNSLPGLTHSLGMATRSGSIWTVFVFSLAKKIRQWTRPFGFLKHPTMRAILDD